MSLATLQSSGRAVALLAGLLLFLLARTAGAQTFPAQVTTALQPPHSIYFNQYTGAEADKLSATIVFNDFNEPSWEVKLRLTIESNGVSIRTRDGYAPPVPLTLTPGVPYRVAGADLMPYFEPGSLTYAGIRPEDLARNGRLPEGFYKFCVEVLDYRSGKLLATASCANAWLRLNDEPTTLTPICGKVIRPITPQNILFQWQLNNPTAPDVTTRTQYQLSLYEVTDPQADPLTAIHNGKALRVFQSDWLEHTTFLYDLNAPVLDLGKRYAYQVQARDVDGRDYFKNNGLSQVCWFYYGYPQNGNIALQSPGNDAAFGLREPTYFKWGAPDNLLPGQPMTYSLRVVRLNPGQEPADAMLQNQAWEEVTTGPVTRTNGDDKVLGKRPETQEKYAWQVVAHTEGQEIARSKVWTFAGPGVIENFYVGRHEVIVSATSNRDLQKLSGRGRVVLGPDGRTAEIAFKDIHVREIAGRNVLVAGDILHDLLDAAPIELSPRVAENGTAYFHPQKVRLNRDGLYLYGNVKWSLPHATAATEKALVRSQAAWLNYDEYKLTGQLLLAEGNFFDLLDPFGFSLDLTTASDFLVYENKYALRMHGAVHLPGEVKGTGAGRVTIPFREAGQLYYIPRENAALEGGISVLRNTNLLVLPNAYTIDLSERQSPGKLAGNAAWKGLYLEQLRVKVPGQLDKMGQLSLRTDTTLTLRPAAGDEHKSWVDAAGLQFALTTDLGGGRAGLFNEFPAKVTGLKLVVENSTVREGHLKGNLLIPFISVSKPFGFTAALSGTGIQRGYLDDLEGTALTFNKDAGEQELHIAIRRAVFAAGERIDMTLDLDWPALGIQLKAVEGFKAWGNYDIGFFKPNGLLPLTNQVNGTLSGFPVTVDAIGAGRNAGAYAFGTSAKMMMAEDVSGANGPPTINVYSVTKNPLLLAEPGPGAAPVTKLVGYDPAAGRQATGARAAGYEAVEKQMTADLLDNQQVVMAQMQKASAEIIGEPAGKSYTAQEILPAPPAAAPPAEAAPKGFRARLNDKQRKIFNDIVDGLIAEVTRPVTDSVNAVTGRLNARITGRVNAMTDSVNRIVADKIDDLVSALAEKVIQRTRRENFDPSDAIHAMADALALELTAEITASVTASVNRNINVPITRLLVEQTAGRVNTFIETETRALVNSALDGDFLVNAAAGNLAKDFPAMVRQIGDDVFKQVNPRNLASTIGRTGHDILNGIDHNELLSRLGQAVVAGAGAIVADALKDVAGEKLEGLVGSISGGAGADAIASLGISMNFDNLGEKLKKGQIHKVFVLDPSNIAVNTKFVSFAGTINYTADDPTFGAVWKGDIVFTVKVPQPKEFSLNGIYINGRKDALSYWFCQLSTADNDTKPGGPMTKLARPLKDPIDLGPVQLAAASGRLYHHMKEVDKGQLVVPDAGTRYGAFLNFVMFDKPQQGGAFRLAVAADVNVAADGNYLIEFDGDLQLVNKNPTVEKPDESAMARGGVSIRYNSAESHFLGKAFVIVNKPGVLCAEGDLLVDVRPSNWRVAIGSREQRIVFIPTCAGWSPTGWLNLDPQVAELGLGLQYSFTAGPVGFDAKVISLHVRADAGVAAGIQAKVQYKPSLAINEVGIWADLWAKILVDYKTPIAKGTVTLVDILCKGDLVMVFNPKPTTLKGNVRGYVRVVGIGCDFDASFSKAM